MLFALLAENNLLIEPQIGIAITMDECEEPPRKAGRGSPKQEMNRTSHEVLERCTMNE
jgi:hypothetical protein